MDVSRVTLADLSCAKLSKSLKLKVQKVIKVRAEFKRNEVKKLSDVFKLSNFYICQHATMFITILETFQPSPIAVS
jgi:hypothetical protein